MVAINHDACPKCQAKMDLIDSKVHEIGKVLDGMDCLDAIYTAAAVLHIAIDVTAKSDDGDPPFVISAMRVNLVTFRKMIAEMIIYQTHNEDDNANHPDP